MDGFIGKFKGVPVVAANDDDFGCILNCAVRYSLGRQTYMPHVVISYIRPILPYLTNRTLFCIERDIREAELRLKTGYGDEEIDKPEWLEFLKDIQREISQREDAT